MDNYIEIHDGDFCLTLYLDNLYTFPAAAFRRLLHLLQNYPEEMGKLSAYLRRQVTICKAGVNGTCREYEAGYRKVNPRSRSATALKILAENKRLTENLRQAKRLYKTYNRLLKICESQGGSST